MVDSPILSKTANALIETAEMRPGLLQAFNYETLGFMGWLIKTFRRRHGGLWVGGTVILYRDRLTFQPNWVNRRVHAADTGVEFPISALKSVTRRFGVFTGIVDVDFGGKHLVFRCFGADSAAAAIRAAASSAS